MAGEEEPELGVRCCNQASALLACQIMLALKFPMKFTAVQ
jgi:hypothetical protein